MKKIAVVMGLAMFACQAGWAADDEANKKILKDAIVGAVTGAVAVEATKEDAPAPAVQSAVSEPEKAAKLEKEKYKKKNFGWKKKDKKRPHGWDMGKKTGWGEGDEPPGLSKKNKKG